VRGAPCRVLGNLDSRITLRARMQARRVPAHIENNRSVKHFDIFNSFLTAKSIPAGAKNSRSEGFLLLKHLKHTAHKHHHHDGAVCPSSGMVLLDEHHTPPPGASAKGVGQGRR